VSSEPNVFLVDDDASVLKAVSRLLVSAGLKVAGFGSARQFLNAYDPAVPGCLVLDLAMPGLNGLELQEELHARNIQIPIVFLTGRADVPATVRAMKGGAVDLLTKPFKDKDLIAAIRRATDADLTKRHHQREMLAARHSLDSLTEREREVLVLVVSGRLNKQSAASLGVTEKTIKVHRARVMAKMGVGSLADLVRLADRLGIRPESEGALAGGGEVDQGPIQVPPRRG
jgi:FixJ family two-component response regulator